MLKIRTAYLEKIYNLEDERTELLLGSDEQEFTGNCLDNDSGLIEQGLIIAGIEEEKCLFMAGLNDETNLEGLDCQHSKIKEEYFDILSLEGDAYEDENDSISHPEGVSFSRKSSDIKAAEMGKVGPIHSGKKTKVNGVSRRKDHTKHLTTKEEHFANDCGKSSSLSSVSFSDDARSGIDAEDQNGEADILFLKLKSIGKLSVPHKKDTGFDLPSDSGVSLTSPSTENHLEINSKKEDACKKQNGSNPRSISPTDNQSKNIRVPELHFDEVADAESSTKAIKQSENKMKEDETRKNDELLRLSIPKEIHKSEMGRIKMKTRMYGKTDGSASAHGVKIQVGKDEMMSKIEQNIQSDKSNWKAQGHSGTQVKTNDTKILSKRREIVKRELRNFAGVTPLPKSKKTEKIHSSCGVPVDTDACSNSSMASPSCPSFPSLSGRPSSAESSFMFTITGSPCENVNAFQEFERQNLAERKNLKKQFRLKIAEAKKKLMEARLLAQEETATKGFNAALKKHTEIKLKRASMKDSTSKSATPTLDPVPSSFSSVVPVRKTVKDVSLSILSSGVTMIQEIRKAEEDFDRAKVKQFQTKMKLQKKKVFSKGSANPQGKKLKSLKKKDRDRLEKYEVEKMITELRSLNMIDYADKLSQAMERKEEYKAKLRHKLNEERKHAAQLAKKQKLEELARIREEKRKKMAEKERLEQERREREALEIAKRQAEATKRREHNLKLQESLNYTLLAADTSKSFTYSYLPVLKPPADQSEKDDRAEKLKKVKARYLEGL